MAWGASQNASITHMPTAVGSSRPTPDGRRSGRIWDSEMCASLAPQRCWQRVGWSSTNARKPFQYAIQVTRSSFPVRLAWGLHLLYRLLLTGDADVWHPQKFLVVGTSMHSQWIYGSSKCVGLIIWTSTGCSSLAVVWFPKNVLY